MPKLVERSEKFTFAVGAAWAVRSMLEAINKSYKKFPGNHDAQLSVVVIAAVEVAQSAMAEGEARYPSYEMPDPTKASMGGMGQ